MVSTARIPDRDAPGLAQAGLAGRCPVCGYEGAILGDFYSGAGGAGMGYHRAGWHVCGIDNRPQPRYPFCFIQADAMTYPMNWATAIHASPPCQAYAETCQGRKRTDHPRLLEPTLELLTASGRPYVIENVATAPMPGSVMLCGSTFGLPIVRHRRFWINPDPGLVPSLCHQGKYGRTVDHGPGIYPYGHGNWRANWLRHVVPAVWPWMTAEESGQAIPPAYTEYIGRQLLEQISEPQAAAQESLL